MGVATMTDVWKRSQHKGAALLVLLAIADNANDDGWAWPGQKYLAQKTRMSERQIRRITEAIAETGELSIHPLRKGRSTINRYRIHPDKMSLQAEIASTGQIHSVHPDIAMSAEPSVEPSGERRTASSSPGGPPSRDPIWDVLAELFGSFPNARRTTARGKRNKAVADLRALGATPETIRLAAKRWPKLYENATLTDMALATHYPHLAAGSATQGAPPCSECGVGGGLHVADCTKAAA